MSTVRSKPLSSINVTFLGTASAQPSSTRNHSSLAVRLSGDVWLFDCGEATQHQIQRSQVKMGKIEKVFITHTHGDHLFGILPLMAGCLNGAGGMIEDVEDPRTSDVNLTQEPPFEIYGPLGTRAYIRNGLAYTYTLLGRRYIVHELRFPGDPQTGDHTQLPLHPFECPGRNILQEDGVWNNIFKDDIVSVSAAPILHSVPCVGFVVTEAPIPGKMDPKRYLPDIKRTKSPMSILAQLQQGESVQLSDGTLLHGPTRRPGRKIVILGDTHDPSPITKLALGADLLIHEATNAHLPDVDVHTKATDTFEILEARAKSRGHSTPQMAGAFATAIGAKKLALNHFSARYASDDQVVMDAIKSLAMENYKAEVVCAKDFMSFDIVSKNVT